MGGLAFASGPDALYTPRMPTAVYRRVRDHCHEVLRRVFVCVATPIEGPGKDDHGDIDVFLAWERSGTFPVAARDPLLQSLPEDPLEAAARLLNAVRTVKGEPGALMLAIPWPDSEPVTTDGDDAGSGGGEPAEPRFIQVDLHHHQDLDSLQWMLFKHAHGDLWNILGTTIRPFGLTIDHVGLYLRIPEIEDYDRKRAKVLLTRDPAAVLGFLGLECAGAQWEEPFAAFEDVFEYAATSCFFWVRPAEPEGEEGEEGHRPPPDHHEPQTGGEVARGKLKANDRRRMNQRALFQRWVDDFLPRCRAQGRFAEPPMTRSDVRDEAFARFPGLQAQYDTRLLEWRVQRQSEGLWKNVIKASLPEAVGAMGEGDGGSAAGAGDGISPMWRSCVAKALKKVIMQGDESFGVVAPAHLRDGRGLYDEEAVRDFVRASWKRVGDVAWEINRQRYRESLDKKGKKRTGSPDGGEETDGKRVDVNPSCAVRGNEGADDAAPGGE